MSYAALAVACFIGLWWFTRSRELFRISVRNGRATVVRGSVPSGFVAEVERAVAGVSRATIRGLKTENGGRLVASGADAATSQRLRNLFALYPASRLRTAPVVEKPTLSRLFWVAWIASWFQRD